MGGGNGRIVIWGVTALGKYLADNIVHKNRKRKPLAFVDNDPKLNNTCICDIPVISCDDLGMMANLKEIIVLLAVRNARHIFEILEQLERIPAGRVGIVRHEVMLSGTGIDPWSSDNRILWIACGKKTNRIIPYIEVNLTDACNLKCRGCTHFSSLYEEDSIYPLDAYERDLLKLRHIGRIFRLRLLGGEPFLVKNLDEYIKVARTIFGESTIEIVTNGLLLTKADGKIMSSIKENDICISISLYPPTYKIKEEIARCLDSCAVLYYFDTGNGEKEITEFYRNLTLHRIHDAEVSGQVCSSASCTFLRNGRLYKCPFDGLINDFYEYYQIDRKHESGIDLAQDGDVLYERLKEYALKPTEFCGYCAEKPERIPWSVKADPALCDWLYQNGR